MQELDVSICQLLQENSRRSFSDLADLLGVSVPTVSEHVRKLEANGTLRNYTADVNPQSFGIDVTAFVFVDVHGTGSYESFRRSCRSNKNILECHAVTGKASHVLKVRTKNTPELESLLRTIQQWKGVTNTHTTVVLSTSKETIQLPFP
jgi:Lrp/AsnC family transcriptional regulator, leucine-responsive regulatory protein